MVELIGHEGDSFTYTKAMLGEICFICQFVKKYFLNQTPSCMCPNCDYIVKAKNQIAPRKTVVGVDRPLYALS